MGRDWASTVGVDDLDEERLAMYLLAQRLFLVAGHCGCSTATSGTGRAGYELAGMSTARLADGALVQRRG